MVCFLGYFVLLYGRQWPNSWSSTEICTKSDHFAFSQQLQHQSSCKCVEKFDTSVSSLGSWLGCRSSFFMLRETPPNRSISGNRHKWIGKVDKKRALGMYYLALGRKHLLHDFSPAPKHITKGLCGKIQGRNRHKKLPAEAFGEPKTIKRIGMDTAAYVNTLRIILGSLFHFFRVVFWE